MLKLTNTLTGNSKFSLPWMDHTVRMYTCGPTVYNYVHIGNLRTYVFEDILRRHLRSKGWKLKHVMNITDIDDKIIKRSIETGQDIKTYTDPYTRAFFEDCEKLRIQKPDVITPATDYIPEMIDIVNRLLESGYAYREGDSIYYRISRFPDYGRLSRFDKRELKVGARIDADEYEKEEPRDFVLVESAEGRQGATMGGAIRRGPSRLASGVFGHGDETSWRHARHPLRRRGQHLSASRKRNRSKRGRHGQAVRAVLGSRRAPAGRWRKDGEVERELLYASRLFEKWI